MRPDVHDVAAHRLQAARRRYTRQRRELIDLLHAVHKPLTVEHILVLDQHLKLSSVYRNLTVLEQANVVRRLSTGQAGHACFELTEELTGHHHHLACNACGAIIDVELEDPVEQQLERELDRHARDRGFEIASHRLDIFGTCPSCARVEMAADVD